MTKKETVDALRAKMKEAGIDVWVVTCGDFHGSEYYSAYFNTLTFLTGFTGESSIAAVTADKAGLWTDGRYHLQAERDRPLQGRPQGREVPAGFPERGTAGRRNARL